MVSDLWFGVVVIVLALLGYCFSESEAARVCGQAENLGLAAASTPATRVCHSAYSRRWCGQSGGSRSLRPADRRRVVRPAVARGG